MSSIFFNIVAWNLNFPTVSTCFTALVQFGKLLELKICASKSALQPVDWNTLNSKTKNEQTQHEHLVFFNIDAGVEHEKNGLVQFFLLFAVQIHFTNLIDDWRRVLKQWCDDQQTEHEPPNLLPHCEELIECIFFVPFSDHSSHLNVTLRLHSTYFLNSLCFAAHLYGDHEEETYEQEYVEAVEEVNFHVEANVNVASRYENVGILGNDIHYSPPMYMPVDNKWKGEANTLVELNHVVFWVLISLLVDWLLHTILVKVQILIIFKQLFFMGWLLLFLKIDIVVFVPNVFFVLKQFLVVCLTKFLILLCLLNLGWKMTGEIHGCKEENAHGKHSIPQNSQLYFI